MAKTVFEMKGLAELIEKVKKMPDKIKEEVDLELTDGAMEMDSIAKSLAPADKGGGSGIRGRMFVDTSKFLLKKVGNSSGYAAYQEFGTGFHAADYVTTLPQEWQEYARTFFVNGQGRVPAHPYLHPAFEQVRPKILERVEKVLKDAVGK